MQSTTRSLLTCSPQPPLWQIQWDELLAQCSWLQAMDGVPQEPLYHAEGDVLIHTRMVVEALIALEEWRALPDDERALVFAATLLHDVGKPDCTQINELGRISSRGHARKGEHISRRLLWLGEDGFQPLTFKQREYIARLVRFHGLPLQFLDKPQPERAVITASLSVRLDHLALLAEADVRGRICADQNELLTRVMLFRDFCQELGCYQSAWQFANAQSRFEYFRNQQRDPHYAAFDSSTFEVVLLSGLPASGKDTWIKQHIQQQPVISLDAIRQELRVSPTDGQGQVIQLARERARELMRKQTSFVWNATNITTALRQPLIDFFTSYGASVRIIYLEIPFNELLERNRARQHMVPETVIMKMLNKLEVPDLTEAHHVEWISTV